VVALLAQAATVVVMTNLTAFVTVRLSLVAAGLTRAVRRAWDARIVAAVLLGAASAIAGASTAVGIVAAQLLGTAFGVACAATVGGSATVWAALAWSRLAVVDLEEPRT
jgi:hypothetical protein